jgi:hypothetical protein
MWMMTEGIKKHFIPVSDFVYGLGILLEGDRVRLYSWL